MPNGKPGDHPVTDILVHRLRVFSPEIDALILEIVRLGYREELERAVNLLDPPPNAQLESRLKELLERLRSA